MKPTTAPDAVLKEVALMRTLDHEHLIAMAEVVDDAKEDALILVLEFAVGGQLMEWNAEARRHACNSPRLAAALAAARPAERGVGPGGPGTLPEIAAQHFLGDAVAGVRDGVPSAA